MREIITTRWVAGDGERTGDPELGQGGGGEGLGSSMHEQGGCLPPLQENSRHRKHVQEKQPPPERTLGEAVSPGQSHIRKTREKGCL